MKQALPVFSVDTVEEAKAIQVRFCRLSYDGRYMWTDFPVGKVEALDAVTKTLEKFCGAKKSLIKKGMR